MEKRRSLFKNAIYHVYSRGNCKKTIFEDKNDFEMFLNICNKLSLEKPFKIFSYCLMNNHYHLMIQTPDGNLSEIMHHINQRYATYFNATHDEIGYVFQGRYGDNLIEDDKEFLTILAYINLNPYHACLVDHVGDWSWSSYNELCQGYSKRNFLNVSYPLGILGKNDFRLFIESNKRKIDKSMSYDLKFIKERILPSLKDEILEIDKMQSSSIKRNFHKIKLLVGKTTLTNAEIAKYLNLHRRTVDRVKAKLSQKDPVVEGQSLIKVL
jgi:REP element-mobilizing transposase RayT